MRSPTLRHGIAIRFAWAALGAACAPVGADLPERPEEHYVRPDADPPQDARARDASPEAGPPDAGFEDAEAGPPDLGPEDTGEIDSGEIDAGEIDAGEPDTGEPDAGEPDTGELDAAAPDVEPIDIGPLGPGVSTLTGHAEEGDADGPRGYARFFNPVNVVVGPHGLVFVADFYNARVAQVTPDGLVRTLYRGPPFERPFGMVFTSSSTLYVQTDRNTAGLLTGAVWRLTLTATTVATSSTSTATLMLTDTATVVVEGTGRHRGLALLPDGRIALADYLDHTVSVFDPAAGTETLIAGAPGVPGYVDGSTSTARFFEPIDLVVTSSSTFIVADRRNNRLRQVTLDGVVTTWAGTGTTASIDGPRLLAGFHSPQAMAIDRSGVIYVADGDSHRIRRIGLTGQVVTIAGDGTEGFADSLDLLQARFAGMEGLDIAADGLYLFVADGSRGLLQVPFHRIRRVELP